MATSGVKIHADQMGCQGRMVPWARLINGKSNRHSAIAVFLE